MISGVPMTKSITFRGILGYPYFGKLPCRDGKRWRMQGLNATGAFLRARGSPKLELPQSKKTYPKSDLVDSRNGGPQYRPQIILILFMGRPKKDIPDFGNPQTLYVPICP